MTVLRLFQHHGLKVRATWPSAVVSAVGVPTFFLLAMGVGLGTQISDADQASLGSGTYLAFIGPGLLVASGMMMGATEGMWPTRALLQWEGVYKAILLTPVGAGELATGHVLWIGLRVLLSASLYLMVLAAFGVPASWWALLMPVVAFGLGVVHGAPMTAITAGLQNDSVYAVAQRAFVFPMFMFSGAFFPISDLPAAAAFVARMLPVWHGVELARSLNEGDLAWRDAGHVAYLVVLAVVGVVLARRQFQKHVTP